MVARYDTKLFFNVECPYAYIWVKDLKKNAQPCSHFDADILQSFSAYCPNTEAWQRGEKQIRHPEPTRTARNP